MSKCYIELRKSSARGTDSITADVMRHLHTRQHLGKTVIVCDQPATTLSAARKQWLKLSRALQKQRASTLNADKILKYTYTIAKMQHMHFTTKPPLERPSADIYFLQPVMLTTLPVNCWSLYVLCPIDLNTVGVITEQLPADALVIDYAQLSLWPQAGLLPRKALEARVAGKWQQVQSFLHGYNIDITKLIVDDVHDIEAMDDALDTLLSGPGRRFLDIANEFQRALELARPIRLTKSVRTSYDTLVLLGHRVQALSPGAFSKQFLQSYNENDTFFLYDAALVRKKLIVGGETLAEAFARHTQAGRPHLARSLQALVESTL